MYIRRNEDVCQFSYIFLHRPGSRAFNNRPPWHSWVLGGDEWKVQLDAAITTDYIEAFNRYVREVDTTAMKANERDNSMVYSTLNKIWLVRRVHLDSQVVVLPRLCRLPMSKQSVNVSNSSNPILIPCLSHI